MILAICYNRSFSEDRKSCYKKFDQNKSKRGRQKVAIQLKHQLAVAVICLFIFYIDYEHVRKIVSVY